jgi:peroxiredoxin
MKMHRLMMAAWIAGALTASAGLEIGDSMVDADVKMKNIDGSMISISDVQGEKGTLVIFTCNHCPFVKGWQKEMTAIGNACKEMGVGVIFINSNDPSAKGDTYEGMQELAKESGYTFPYAVDATSDIARNFGATKTPDIFLFDAEQKLVYQGAVGEGAQEPKEGGEPWLRNALAELTAGKPIEKSQTKAVGCSIKFR